MNRTSVQLITIILSLVLLVSDTSAKIIYVDASAAGANNGTSWANAFKYLQDGISAAAANDEIHIAAGTYRPDQGNGYTPGDRNASFVLKNLVRMIGGYPAGGGDTPDWQANPTVLSGDLLADDNPATAVKDLLTDATRSDNSYHVVRGELCGAPTRLDGLFIIHGQADGADTLGSGGGWYNAGKSSPTIVNCAFRRNAAKTIGGAWYNNGFNCLPVLTNVTFNMNLAESGGSIAMVETGANVKLDNCHFSGNIATRYGGSIYLKSSAPKILNCDITGENAGNSGGGGSVFASWSSNPTIIGCSFTSNSGGYGGSVYTNLSSNINLSSCTFIGNNSIFNGGACYFIEGGHAQVEKCEFLQNHSNAAGGAVFNNSCSAAYNNCTFTENSSAAWGGAICAEYSTYEINKAYFFNNSALTSGGAIRSGGGTGKISGCKFIGNHSASYGGAILNHAVQQWNMYLNVNNCIFVGNYTSNTGSCGGAIANLYARYYECTSPYHCGYFENYSVASFTNSSFYGNTAVDRGGGIFTDHINSTNTYRNCIVYGNSDKSGGNFSESAQLHYGFNTVHYSCIQGLSSSMGDGNVGEDPMFVNPLGDDWIAGTLDDNLRLAPGSPCIDAGKNQFAIDAGLTTDLDCMTRFWDDVDTLDTGVGTSPIVDMGAYEYNPNECIKDTAPFFNDWIAWNKPSCWCYSRQCRGDINGLKEPIGGLWVGATDLTLFKTAYGKNDAALALVPDGICADLNHLKERIGGLRVGATDLSLFKTFYGKPEATVTVCDMADFNFWLSPECK